MTYLSMDAFAELPPGTKFRHQFIDATIEPPKMIWQTFMKMQPTGGDIGSCSLVNLLDGTLVHAVELWDMHEFKQEDNPFANPDECVERYAWEKDLMPDSQYVPLWDRRISNLEDVMQHLGIDSPTSPDQPTMFFSDDGMGMVYYAYPQETEDRDIEEVNDFLRSFNDDEPEGL